MKRKINKLCVIAGAFLLLALVPRAALADANVTYYLDITTNWPGSSYASEYAYVVSNARWAGLPTPPNMTNGQIQLFLSPDVTINFSAMRNYFLPTNVTHNTTAGSQSYTNFYVPYTNALSVTITGTNDMTANVVWSLSASPTELTNSTAYQASYTNNHALTPIPTGQYTVTFPDITGWITPDPVSTNITGDSPMTNSVAVVYSWLGSNFPAFTSDITFMGESNGLFKTPSRASVIAANSLVSANHTGDVSINGVVDVTIARRGSTNDDYEPTELVPYNKLRSEIAKSSALSIYANTNAHPVVAGVTILSKEIPDAWCTTNTYSDAGTYLVATRLYTNYVNQLRFGKYIADVAAYKDGLSDLNLYLELITTDGVSTNVLSTSLPGKLLTTAESLSQLLCGLETNQPVAAGFYPGYNLLAIKTGVPSTDLILCGGNGSLTSLSTPGLASADGDFVETDPVASSNLLAHTTNTANPHLVDAAQVGAVASNDASYLSILRTMTNYVPVASSSNYLTYNPVTRLLSGCVTNQGGGVGTITNMLGSDGSIIWTQSGGPQPDGSVTQAVAGWSGYSATQQVVWVKAAANTGIVVTTNTLVLQTLGGDWEDATDTDFRPGWATNEDNVGYAGSAFHNDGIGTNGTSEECELTFNISGDDEVLGLEVILVHARGALYESATGHVYFVVGVATSDTKSVQAILEWTTNLLGGPTDKWGLDISTKDDLTNLVAHVYYDYGVPSEASQTVYGNYFGVKVYAQNTTTTWRAGFDGTNWTITRDGVVLVNATNVATKAENIATSNAIPTTAAQVGAVATSGGTMTGAIIMGTNAVRYGTNAIALYGGVLNGTNGLYFTPNGSTNNYWILGGP